MKAALALVVFLVLVIAYVFAGSVAAISVNRCYPGFSGCAEVGR
jgi:hypothetical protein